MSAGLLEPVARVALGLLVKRLSGLGCVISLPTPRPAALSPAARVTVHMLQEPDCFVSQPEALQRDLVLVAGAGRLLPSRAGR